MEIYEVASRIEKRKVSRGAAAQTIVRMEKKGLVASEESGGFRCYEVTQDGRIALRAALDTMKTYQRLATKAGL